MATFFQTQNGVAYLVIADNEATNTPQDAADKTAATITWDPDDITDSDDQAEVIGKLEQVVRNAAAMGTPCRLVVTLGAATGSPATSWKVTYRDDQAADWNPIPGLASLTVTASDTVTAEFTMPPGLRELRVEAASGSLDDSNYFAASTIYLAVPLAEPLEDADITRA